MTDTTAKILNLGISHGTPLFFFDVIQNFKCDFWRDNKLLIRMILNATSTYLILALAILGSAQGKLSTEHFYTHID